MRWSIDAALAAGATEVIVVVPREQTDEHTAAADAIPDGVRTVAGGARRQDSVAAGLAEVTSPSVVVHDAVRPFSPPELFVAVVEALGTADGAIAAVPAPDTLKRVADSTITDTLDRADVWLAQTPQAFLTDALRDAHDRARTEGFEATDDAALLERYGGRVTVVEASSMNMKITTAADWTVARAIAGTLS